MSDKVELKVDFCSYEAAKYAVEHWHYSKTMPAGKTVKLGVWENGIFIGVVIFSRGANNHIGSQYGLDQTRVCELTRIALKQHKTQVSKIASIAQKIMLSLSPELRLIVSYADPEMGHIGAIYQAMNWVYVGKSKPQRFTLGLDNKIVHKRSTFSKFGTVSGQKYSNILWKHKYLYPLDRAMRKQIEPLAKPYPKRETCGLGEIDSAASSNSQTGGASPTSPLLLTT